MTNMNILDVLKSRDCGITSEQVLCGELNTMLRRGLRVVSICFDGSGRSRTVADKLTYEYSIPAVRLVGGIRQFKNDQDIAQYLSSIQSIISDSPNVAVILTPIEMFQHSGFINNVRASRYQNSTRAIESILRMESQ